MLQTFCYFLELSVSIYFFCVVALFLINVCEFMPLTQHDPVEEKIFIRPPKNEGSSAANYSEPKFTQQKPPRKSKSKDRIDPKGKPESTEGLPTTQDEKKTSVERHGTPESEQPATEPEPTEDGQKTETEAAQETTTEATASNEPEAQIDEAPTADPGEVAGPGPGETAEHVEGGENDPPTEPD